MKVFLRSLFTVTNAWREREREQLNNLMTYLKRKRTCQTQNSIDRNTKNRTEANEMEVTTLNNN